MDVYILCLFISLVLIYILIPIVYFSKFITIKITLSGLKYLLICSVTLMIFTFFLSYLINRTDTIYSVIGLNFALYLIDLSIMTIISTKKELKKLKNHIN